MSRQSKIREATERADRDQAAADREVAERAAQGDANAGAAEGAAENGQEAKPKKKRDVSYSIYGLARSNNEWEHIQDMRTIGMVRKWVVGSQNLARKTYSALKVTRTKLAGVVNLDFARPDENTIKEQVR